MSADNITRRSLKERKTGKTDWARLEAQSDVDITRAVCSDKDVASIANDEWMAAAEVVTPNKRSITIRLDADVIDYFKHVGGGYQTRINQVLRAYVASRAGK